MTTETKKLPNVSPYIFLLFFFVEKQTKTWKTQKEFQIWFVSERELALRVILFVVNGAFDWLGSRFGVSESNEFRNRIIYECPIRHVTLC